MEATLKYMGINRSSPVIEEELFRCDIDDGFGKDLVGSRPSLSGSDQGKTEALLFGDSPLSRQSPTLGDTLSPGVSLAPPIHEL